MTRAFVADIFSRFAPLSLLPYEDCETFLSTDAGVSWKMALAEAHKYEFGDSGSILIAAPDESPTSIIRYSLDAGKSW